MAKSSASPRSKVPKKLPLRRGISYGRVSTLGQVENDEGFRKNDASPEAQRQRCLDFVKFLEHKKDVPHELSDHISDEGFSGKNTNRPGFQRLWDLIGSGTIDFVISPELSRLSRNVMDFLELVAHAEKHSVDIIIIGLDLDTSSPFGRTIVIILVALAQFEREMTSVRVKENALSRLINDGKINGAGEILGLDRNPDCPGHFLVNEAELVKAEKLLNLFLKFSSKKKVLEVARELGITGKKGRELTGHMLDTLLQNVRWRYRGLWYANKENEDQDGSSLPESKRYQIVNLPHGQILPKGLLDDAEAKIRDTYENNKQCGKNGHIYLLSHCLFFEDGSNFSGQIGKNVRYYYNTKNKIRLRCDHLDPFILKEVKQRFLDHDKFEAMVESAIKRRQLELPNVERRIGEVRKQIEKVEQTNCDLRAGLVGDGSSRRANFMDWLSEQVEDISRQKRQFESELNALERQRDEIMKKSGLVDLQGTVKDLLSNFDDLTGTEKRNIIERIIKRITVERGNKLNIEFYGDPPPLRSVNLRKRMCDREVNGSVMELGYKQDFPPAQPTIITDFNVIPLFRNESFLRQKYLVEGLSTRQIAELVFSARSTVVSALDRYGIALREADQSPWYRRGQLGYGKRVVNGRVVVNQREVEVIQQIGTLRDKGYSYWKIADILNSMGVPTKSRRAKWQAATVMKLLKRGNVE